MNKYACRLKGQRGRGRAVVAKSPAIAAETFFAAHGVGKTSDNVVLVDGLSYRLRSIWKAVKL